MLTVLQPSFKKKLLQICLILGTAILLVSLVKEIGAAENRVMRMGGEDRYETAALIAESEYESASKVIIARGDQEGDFADGLSASVLAGVEDAPVLLTKVDSLSASTAGTIAELNAEKALLLGGEKAVSSDVEDELADLGLDVERVAGEDRFDTAAQIAKMANTKKELSDHAFVVNGTATADALIAGTAAVRDRIPVLLVRKNEVPAVTEEVIAALGVEAVSLIGGSKVIDDAVETSLEEITNVAGRLAGADRYATSVAFAEEKFSGEGNLILSGGPDDHLADAVGACIYKLPILYVQSIPEVVQEYMDQVVTSNSEIKIMGGESAVSPEVEDSANRSITEAPTPSEYGFQFDFPDQIEETETITGIVDFAVEDEGDTGYQGVRFAVEAEGDGDVEFESSRGEEQYDFENDGYWGPPEGFDVEADYSEQMEWSLNFSEAGEYVISFSLVEAETGEVIAGTTGSIEVEVESPPASPGPEPSDADISIAADNLEDVFEDQEASHRYEDKVKVEIEESAGEKTENLAVTLAIYAGDEENEIFKKIKEPADIQEETVVVDFDIDEEIDTADNYTAMVKAEADNADKAETAQEFEIIPSYPAEFSLEVVVEEDAHGENSSFEHRTVEKPEDNFDLGTIKILLSDFLDEYENEIVDVGALEIDQDESELTLIAENNENENDDINLGLPDLSVKQNEKEGVLYYKENLDNVLGEVIDAGLNLDIHTSVDAKLESDDHNGWNVQLSEVKDQLPPFPVGEINDILVEIVDKEVGNVEETMADGINLFCIKKGLNMENLEEAVEVYEKVDKIFEHLEDVTKKNSLEDESERLNKIGEKTDAVEDMIIDVINAFSEEDGVIVSLFEDLADYFNLDDEGDKEELPDSMKDAKDFIKNIEDANKDKGYEHWGEEINEATDAARDEGIEMAKLGFRVLLNSLLEISLESTEGNDDGDLLDIQVPWLEDEEDKDEEEEMFNEMLEIEVLDKEGSNAPSVELNWDSEAEGYKLKVKDKGDLENEDKIALNIVAGAENEEENGAEVDDIAAYFEIDSITRLNGIYYENEGNESGYIKDLEDITLRLDVYPDVGGKGYVHAVPGGEHDISDGDLKIEVNGEVMGEEDEGYQELEDDSILVELDEEIASGDEVKAYYHYGDYRHEWEHTVTELTMDVNWGDQDGEDTKLSGELDTKWDYFKLDPVFLEYAFDGDEEDIEGFHPFVFHYEDICEDMEVLNYDSYEFDDNDNIVEENGVIKVWNVNVEDKNLQLNFANLEDLEGVGDVLSEGGRTIHLEGSYDLFD